MGALSFEIRDNYVYLVGFAEEKGEKFIGENVKTYKMVF